jgi:capsule polysaccharide export protein KpsE/RkpR
MAIIVVYYRHWEIENFYSGQVTEFLDNPDPSSEPEKKLCDEACTLAPINTQIITINTRLDTLEKLTATQTTKIGVNTTSAAKTAAEMLALQVELKKAEAELEAASKDQAPK